MLMNLFFFSFTEEANAKCTCGKLFFLFSPPPLLFSERLSFKYTDSYNCFMRNVLTILHCVFQSTHYILFQNLDAAQKYSFFHYLLNENSCLLYSRFTVSNTNGRFQIFFFKSRVRYLMAPCHLKYVLV